MNPHAKARRHKEDTMNTILGLQGLGNSGCEYRLRALAPCRDYFFVICRFAPLLACQLFIMLPIARAAEAVWTERDVLRQPGVVSAEFIFEQAPSRECHASTIVETPTGLVAAWFGGT